MNISKEIEMILQKYGVATKMEITTGNTSDGVQTYYATFPVSFVSHFISHFTTQDVAEDLIQELTNLIAQREREAVEGFVEWILAKEKEERDAPVLREMRFISFVTRWETWLQKYLEVYLSQTKGDKE